MTKEQALSRSMKYCSLREYAATDMEIKLNDWGISVVESKWVMEQLFAHKFIDEFRLARSFANDKLRFNKWGKLKIRNNLQQKKVDSKAIVEALDQINPEAYLEILTEE